MKIIDFFHIVCSIPQIVLPLYSWIPVVVAVLLCTLVIVLLRKRYVDCYNKKLEYFSSISYLFRTPLTFIMSPLRVMREAQGLTDEQKSLFDFMLVNADRLLKLSGCVADLKYRDDRVIAFQPEKTDLITFLGDIYKRFRYVADSQNVTYKFDSQVVTYSSFIDRTKLDMAFYILLSDIFSYNTENKSVILSVETLGSNIIIKVCDSDSVFNTLHDSPVQLDICFAKYFINIHHGNLVANKIGDNGMELTITLTPGIEFKNNATNTTFEYIRPVALPKVKNSMRVSGDGKDGGSETLLIVDADTNILNYLSTLFSSLYNVETASNGQTGLDKAVATLPDLVITDISMPKMDGLQMCRNLKNNCDTCHIPVLVLSVQDSAQSRMECIENDVDMFVPKPFDFKYLDLSVKRLLERRKMLRNSYSNEIPIPDGRIATIAERDLLKRVTAVIKKRLSDPTLNVETLSDEVGVSRGHLQRRFKAITGQNPNEYIRTTRLNAAAELLANKDISIKEIVDITGFGSQSYFCTLFLKHFNISPKQYRSQTKGEENID